MIHVSWIVQWHWPWSCQRNIQNWNLKHFRFTTEDLCNVRCLFCMLVLKISPKKIYLCRFVCRCFILFKQNGLFGLSSLFQIKLLIFHFIFNIKHEYGDFDLFSISHVWFSQRGHGDVLDLAIAFSVFIRWTLLTIMQNLMNGLDIPEHHILCL